MTMMVPRKRRSMFDDFFGDPFGGLLGTMPTAQATPVLMRTDIKEHESGFEIAIDLPGFTKDNVTAELKDGILTVTACTTSETDESNEQGTFIRKERFTGRCSRSYYVGDDIEEADIKAKFDNGLLQISVPKKVEQPKLEEARSISID